MTNDSGRDPLGQALAVPVEPVARLDPSGFDPSRGGFYQDMDRAFEIALQTLHLSESVETGARLFYADGMNNREGHVSERVAARVIAAVFAATAALKNERNAVCRYINQCADAFSGVPLDAAAMGLDAGEARRYALDAILRYHNLADYIQERAHAIATEARRAETENTGSVHESATAESGDAQPQSVSGLSHTGSDHG